MENLEIARALADVAGLLEISGANPFRIRAYENAARTVEAHAVPLRRMVAEGAALTELPGIGKDIAGAIVELVETGRLARLEALKQEIPGSLLELTRLPGLGAKRVRRLWQELGVQTLDDLERAARADEIKELEGFGATTQQKILDGIAVRRRHVERIKWVDAAQFVEPLLAYLRAAPGAQRVEVAGSYRRHRETVRDVDLLVMAEDSGPVVERFVSYAEVARTELAGDTKATVVLKSGLQVDLRVVSPASYGAALVYFTGSKEHNVALRKRAVGRGLRVSEYGVCRVGEAEAAADDPFAGEYLAGAEEDDVYEALELRWIPPEVREDRGEIEAAAQGSLPALITENQLRGDLQMHSTWSDGKDSLEAMLDACVARGYEYFAITDHSKALAMTGGLDERKLRAQWEEIDEIVSRRTEIRVLRGMEVDILIDGQLDLEDALLAELDLVVVSVHSHFGLPAAEQTERILRAVQHPSVHVLAHPTGRLINRREPMEFDLDEVLRAAAASGVAVELNAHPDRLDLKDTQLRRAKELGVPVVISTDAHRTEDLSLMRHGIAQARRAWLEPGDVLNTRSVDDLLASLRS